MENISFVFFFVALVFLVFFLYRSRNSLSKFLLDELRGQLQKEFLFNREELSKNLHENRIELTQSLQRLNDTILIKAKDDRDELRKTLKEFESSFVKNVETFNTIQKEKFDQMKLKQDEMIKTTEIRLERMRETVDEKLHKTLEERLGKSFEMVTKQLLVVQKLAP